jgi:hypothetical protein
LAPGVADGIDTGLIVLDLPDAGATGPKDRRQTQKGGDETESSTTENGYQQVLAQEL